MTDLKDLFTDDRPPERIAKRLARAGLCSRREAERWITEGRVEVDGKVLDSPALTVTDSSRIVVDGKALPVIEPPRLWRYHKPRGLVTTARDPEGRPTVFENLPGDLPRVISVGRLDVESEGLLLLTNDGALSRHLELPNTGWLRRYRVRVFGRPDPKQLEALKDGITVEGVSYGAIEAVLDKQGPSNAWLTVGIREGKNREVRKVLAHLGLEVNRLIRTSYGPFQLGNLKDGSVEEVKRRILREQLGLRQSARDKKEEGGDAGATRKSGPKPAGKKVPGHASGKQATGKRTGNDRNRKPGGKQGKDQPRGRKTLSLSKAGKPDDTGSGSRKGQNRKGQIGKGAGRADHRRAPSRNKT